MQWVNPQLLPWKRHSDLAILIVQTSAKYAPDTIAGNFLQDSVRHVSNLAGKLRKTPEQVWIDTKRYPLFLWQPIWGQSKGKEDCFIIEATVYQCSPGFHEIECPPMSPQVGDKFPK